MGVLVGIAIAIITIASILAIMGAMVMMSEHIENRRATRGIAPWDNTPWGKDIDEIEDERHRIYN